MFCSQYTKLLVSILCGLENSATVPIKSTFLRFSAHYGVPPECLRFSAAKVWENWIIAPAHLFGDTFGTPLRNCPIVWFHQLGCLHQKVVPLHMERLDSCQEERENKWKNANKDNCIPTTPLSLARSSHFILLFLGTYIYLFS